MFGFKSRWFQLFSFCRQTLIMMVFEVWDKSNALFPQFSASLAFNVKRTKSCIQSWLSVSVLRLHSECVTLFSLLQCIIEHWESHIPVKALSRITITANSYSIKYIFFHTTVPCFLFTLLNNLTSRCGQWSSCGLFYRIPLTISLY
jgi:hypothetical protein